MRDQSIGQAQWEPCPPLTANRHAQMIASWRTGRGLYPMMGCFLYKKKKERGRAEYKRVLI